MRAFAADDPRGFLARFPGGAVIDAGPEPGRWIPTGSRNFTLPHSVSRSLARRECSAVLYLLPLARSEVLRFAGHPDALEEALLAGAFVWPF